MLALLDTNYKYLHANDHYVGAFGMTQDHIVGRSVEQVFGEEFFTGVIRPHADRCMSGEDVRYEDWFDFPAAGRKYMQITYNRFLGAGEEVLGFTVNGRDITDKKRAEDALLQHQEDLEATIEERTMDLRQSEHRLAEETTATAEIVNELLAEVADDSETERQVLNACLAATSGKFGMIGVINAHGNFDTTTYNFKSLDQCAFPEAMAWDLTTGMTIRGIWGWPMIHGEPLVCNDLDSHPDRVGQPAGHAPIDCFLGVPVKEDAKVTGMVAVANKDGGFTRADQETLARLVGIMTVSKRYREALRKAKLTGAELERQVKQRTEELAAANKELEAFAYSVSHDLRAPLRSIDGFSLALAEDCADALDAQGKDYLQRVRAGCQQMGRLIDDLLKLSRLTRQPMGREAVDLSGLAAGIVARLRQTQPERQVEFAVAKGLFAQGDRSLLQVLLENLLGNAWKFTGTHPRARIEFGKTEVEGHPAFFVRDDGVGFDMAYVDKLFGAFQRLHTVEEFPGTGIGLATVQRIVHRHGGRVWAEGAVEKGATFYFTLQTTRNENGDRT